MARALNRTLILPPVLPHLGNLSTYHGTVLDDAKGEFKTKTNLWNIYLNAIEEGYYFPMDHVIDTRFSFANSSIIDFRDFVKTVPRSTLSTWVLETKYSHFNTIWIHNRPDLEGTNAALETSLRGGSHTRR
jgi:hypothetical protein